MKFADCCMPIVSEEDKKKYLEKQGKFRRILEISVFKVSGYPEMHVGLLASCCVLGSVGR